MGDLQENRRNEGRGEEEIRRIEEMRGEERRGDQENRRNEGGGEERRSGE